MKKIKVGFGKKKFDVNVKELTAIQQAKGLMFRGRNCPNLLFDRGGRWAIHSFFVFFDFLAVWLDEKNNVLEYKLVKPFTFHVIPKHKFAKLIEIPVNNRNKRLITHFPSVYAKV